MQNKEELEKQVFDETYKKQASKARKIFTLTFSIMGGVIFMLGFLFLVVVEEETLGIVYFVLGAFLLLMALIFGLVFPKNYDYSKFKKRLNSYGYVNIYECIARITVLEKRLDELEKELESLRVKNENGDKTQEN